MMSVRLLLPDKWGHEHGASAEHLGAHAGGTRLAAAGVPIASHQIQASTGLSATGWSSDAANGPTAVSHGSNATAPAGPGMIVSRWVRSIPL